MIRLVGRHSVEEIVLKRAHSKLELTNTVIEGGQVHIVHSIVASIAQPTFYRYIIMFTVFSWHDIISWSSNGGC